MMVIILWLFPADMISIHVESLAGLRTELKRLPVSKVRAYTYM